MKQIYWLVIISLLSAVAAGVLFLLFAMGQMADVKQALDSDKYDTGAPHTQTEVPYTTRELDATRVDPIQENVCDFADIKKTVANTLEQAFSNHDGMWELMSTKEHTVSPFEYARVGSGEKIAVCDVELSYRDIGTSSSETPEHEEEPSYKLDQLLREDGWTTSGQMDLVSETLQKRLNLALLSGGRAYSSVDVYVKFYPYERAVQFARVTSGTTITSRDALQEGGTGNPCPCFENLSLSMTGKIALSEYFEQFGSDIIVE